MQPPASWVGHLTVKQQQNICTTIKNSPVLTAILNVTKDVLPWDQADGMGEVVAGGVRHAGSGINFFGDSPEDWQFTHSNLAFKEFFQKQRRLPAPFLIENSKVEIAEKWSNMGEVFALYYELIHLAEYVDRTIENCTPIPGSANGLNFPTDTTGKMGCTTVSTFLLELLSTLSANSV